MGKIAEWARRPTFCLWSLSFYLENRVLPTDTDEIARISPERKAEILDRRSSPSPAVRSLQAATDKALGGR